MSEPGPRQASGRAASFWMTIIDRLRSRAPVPHAEYHDLSVQPQRDARGEVIGIHGAAVDVSGQRVAHGHAEFLADLMDAFAPLASAAEVVCIAGERIHRQFGAARVNFSDVHADECTVTVFGGFHDAKLQDDRATHRLQDYFDPGMLAELAAGRPVPVDDVLADPRTAAHAAAFARWGVRSLVLAPLRSDGRWKFLLAVAKSEPCMWHADEVTLLNETGRRVHTRLERARAEESLRVAHDSLQYELTDRKRYEAALREREERLRLSLRAASAGSWDWDIAADRVLWSQEEYEHYGVHPGSAPLQFADWLEFVHPEDRAQVQRAMRDAVEGRTPELAVEFRVKGGDGGEHWLLSLGKVVRDDMGRAGRMIGISLDISDRKRGEEAAARLAAIVSASDDAVISKTLDGIVQSWNGAAERMFGYSAREMIGQSILRIIPPERHQEEDTILRELRRGHRIEHYESVRVCKDGRRLDVSLTVFPIPDASGRPVAAAKVARDISARKRGEEERRRREAEYRTLFEAAGAGNAEVELQTGRFKRVNRKYCELVGYSADELLGGKTVFDVTHPEDRARGIGLDPLVRDDWSTFDVEKRYVRKDGSVIWVHLTATALRDEAGRPYRALGSVFDITQRKQAEAALREEDRRKDEFLATLAHELRNPLAPVRNAVQLMKTRGVSDAEITWARDVIDRQVERMARLIDDLLDVSRITLGKVELHREPVDLAKVLLDAVETSRPLIGAGAHQLTVALPPEPVTVHADTTRLSQVFANLLNNAAKFTGRGGRIALSAERAGEQAVVRVIDNGIGIAHDKLVSIFELFAQVRSDAAELPDGGLGIGLSLARRLVEMHGGAIEAKSDGAGQGSTFTVRLPVAAPAVDTPVAANGEGGARSDLTGGRVLVVDDNRDAVASLAMLLEAKGSTVAIAHDGLEAVRTTEVFQPDVILLDIGLPRLNGFDVCRRIRELPGGDRIVIVAVTGWGQETDRARAREAGFDDHMVKPVDPQELMQLVARTTRRRATETA